MGGLEIQSVFIIISDVVLRGSEYQPFRCVPHKRSGETLQSFGLETLPSTLHNIDVSL